MMSKELDVAIEAAREGGKLLLEYYGRVKVKYKPDRSIITKADIEAEKRIRSILKKEFPDFSILGEELGCDKGDSEYVWVIDPLDGTTNYSMRNPFFNVSIALTYRREAILGVVFYPFEEEVFYAEKGAGARLNGDLIFPSKEGEIENSLLTFCHGRDESSIRRIINVFGKLKRINSKVRQIGAAALELCYVACGRTESFLMVGVNTWDVLAGALIVKEAGGTISDFDGNPFSINSKNILASNGRIHLRMLELLKDL